MFNFFEQVPMLLMSTHIGTISCLTLGFFFFVYCCHTVIYFKHTNHSTKTFFGVTKKLTEKSNKLLVLTSLCTGGILQENQVL